MLHSNNYMAERPSIYLESKLKEFNPLYNLTEKISATPRKKLFSSFITPKL